MSTWHRSSRDLTPTPVGRLALGTCTTDGRTDYDVRSVAAATETIRVRKSADRFGEFIEEEVAAVAAARGKRLQSESNRASL